MVIVCLIILILVILGLLLTKNYKRNERLDLNKKDNPFILLYSLSFKIMDKFKIVNYFKKKEYLDGVKKVSIIIFMLSITSFLCILLALSSDEESDINNNVLNRPSYVQNSQKIDVNVYKDGNETPYEVEFDVEARQFNLEEVNENFVLAYDYLMKNMLKDNDSLENVTSDLNLITQVSEYAISVEWYSSDYNIVDYDGSVYNSGFENDNLETVSIGLTAILKYGNYSCEYPIDIIVFPPYLSEEERFINLIKSAIEKASNSTIFEDKVNLPTVVNGIELKYEIPSENNNSSVIVILCILITVVLILGVEWQKKKEKDSRDKQLKYDYSEVVSKLTLLAGAGMTIFRAWEKISLDYKNQRNKSGCKLHFAYEEMLITYYQMKSGMSEGKSYAEFGKRCNIKEYLKLGALLEQNLKKGTKGLTQMLEVESLEAFQERKNIAKRLGEEAGTKLLAPMGIMLVVVMIIVIFPALSSFSI